MSIVGYPPPSSVQVGDGDCTIPINTSHHCGIRVAAILDDPTIAPSLGMTLALKNYFGANQPNEDRGALFSAAMLFFNRGQVISRKPSKRSRRQARRTWDWEYDADRLVADFQRFYAIDITDPDTHIHWWRFMALYNGLPSDTSQTMQAIGIRSKSASDCKTREEREHLQRQKKALALPPRTASEVTPDL